MFFMQIINFLARIDQQAEIFHSRLSKHYCNIKSVSIINIHFSQGNHIFLERIDQQAEIDHSSLSEQYSNIKSITMIHIHFFQRNSIVFSKDRSASRDLSF